MEFRAVPQPAIHDAAQDRDCVPQFGVAQIKRREAEAHDVGRAEISDDVVRGEALDDRPAVLMREADLAAALRGIFRRHEAEAVARQFRPHQRREDIGLAQRFRAQLFERRLQHEIDADLKCREAQHRRRADGRAGNALRRAERTFKGERRGMTEPARQGGCDAILMAPRNGEKRRRAGPAIEEFVAAADGKIGVHAGKIERHRAGRMREVPDHQRAFGVRRFRDLRHVVHAARAIAHMGEEHAGDIVVDDRGKFFRRGRLEHMVPAQVAYQSLHDIKIGGEIFALGQNRAPRRIERERRRQNLEQIDRGGVGDDRFAFAGTDQPSDFGPHTHLQIDPAMNVPAADQVPAPFLFDHFADAVGHGFGHRTQRIAVEIDRAFGQKEAIAERPQRIFAVKRFKIDAGDVCGQAIGTFTG